MKCLKTISGCQQYVVKVADTSTYTRKFCGYLCVSTRTRSRKFEVFRNELQGRLHYNIRRRRVADHFFRIHQFLHIRPPLSMARNIPFLAGLGLASVIGCYVIFPKPVVAVYSKLSGKEMSKPEKWSQRASLVAKQVTNPVAEVQFYRNIGLFGAAVYLIATQGHQMTVA